MTNFLLILKDNAYVWAIVILVSIALAFFGIVQNIKRKQLIFYFETNFILDVSTRKIEELTVYYGDDKIENFMVSKIAFVNSGNLTINYSDIPVAAPLLIKVDEESSILFAKVLNQSNESSLVSLSNISPSIVEVKFDYLEKKEGAVIQIFHTGRVYNIDICGKLKGGQIITPIKADDSKSVKAKKERVYNNSHIVSLLKIAIYTIFQLCVVLIVFSANFNLSFDTKFLLPKLILPNFFLDTLVLLTVFLFPMTMLWISRIQKAKSFMPKELRNYFNKV